MKINLNKIADYTTILYLVSTMVIPRSFIAIKLSLLILFIAVFLIQFYRNKKLSINRNIAIFYIMIMFIGITWSVIGYINNGSIIGIQDNFKLWFFWSICYAILILIFIQRNTLPLFHKAVVISGILISIINFIGMYSVFYGANFIPDSIEKELDLRIGFHDGYVQISSQNIGSLFFILPYLIAILVRTDSNKLKNFWLKLSFLLCIILTIYSGRRALWICVIMTPVILIGISFFLNKMHLIKLSFKRFTYLFLLLGILSLGIFIQSESFDIPALNHFKDAFSSEDPRSIQKVFLLKSFWNYPFFGSGFGVGVGIVRSVEASWLYELSYHQILFNFGIVGVILILATVVPFLILIFRKFKKSKFNHLIPFCILTGIASFALGSYSNPYFQSFDFLIYISMIPYLASIEINKSDDFA